MSSNTNINDCEHSDMQSDISDLPIELTEENLYDLAELFKVYGDSTRIQIIYVLLDGEMSVGEIAERLNMNASAISHQLRVLKQAKLVRNRRAGKNIFYFLEDEHVITIMKQGMVHILE